MAGQVEGAHSILGSISKSIEYQRKEVMLSLWNSSGELCPVLGSILEEECEGIGGNTEEGQYNMANPLNLHIFGHQGTTYHGQSTGISYCSCEDRLERLRLFALDGTVEYPEGYGQGKY